MSTGLIPFHFYEADPHSGAGNCWCGRAKRSPLHPHRFAAAGVNPEICTCTKPEDHPVHTQRVERP